MDVFHVQTSSGLLQGINYTLIAVAVVAILTGVVLLALKRRDPQTIRRASGALLIGFILLATGVGLNSGGTTGSAIVIRPGSISVSGKFIGNSTYPASEIKSAFIGNINTGAITLSQRDYGTSLGDINEGVYTLSNGATAHVVSTNQTDLFVALDSGIYLVLGTSNTAVLAGDFAAEVAPVANLTS